MGKYGLLPIIFLIFGAATRDVSADKPLRIVSGLVTKEGEFPFVVSVRYDDVFRCGGSIISSKHVLTAAHCIEDRTADRFIIRSGTIFRERSGQNHYVSHIAQHPTFNSQDESTFAYDVAVLTLTAPITMDNMNSIIPIASRNTPDGIKAQLIGWGRTEVNIPASDVQRKAHMHTISREECKGRTGDFIDDKHLCTLEMPGIGACMGDSGSPLVYENEVVGIASWVYPCALGVPDVYARVYSHRDYIQDAIKNYP